MRRVRDEPSAIAARAAHDAREHALADAGLTPLRDVLRRVAWGHGDPQRGEGALRSFAASQAIRDRDLGPGSPVAFRLDRDLQDAFAAFGSLSAEAWTQITHSLDAQDWLFLVGHLVELTRGAQWSIGRRLLERALGGVGTGMRRQPGADIAMRAALEALADFSATPVTSGLADRFERWVFAHGPPTPREGWRRREAMTDRCEAERLRWDELPAVWFHQHVSPTLQRHPVMARAWIMSGPYAVFDIAGLVAQLTAHPRGLRGDAAVMLKMLGNDGCRLVLCERRDLRARDIARLAAFQPQLLLQHMEPQISRWGATAAQLWDRHGKEGSAFDAALLAGELLRDPQTVGTGRVVVVDAIAKILPEIRVHDNDDVGEVRLLIGLLAHPAVWAALPTDSKRAILTHPAAAVRLLGIQAIGAMAADQGLPASDA